MQIEIDISEDDTEKAAVLKVLANEDIHVLIQAYAYAKNLELYGVDVSEKWETVVQQCRALQRAYLKGCSDERKKIIDDMSRDAINKAVDNLCDTNPFNNEWLKELKQLREERPHGKWERHYSRPGVYADLFWHCSNCGYKCREDYANIYYKYCPNCGSYNKEVTND